MKTRRTLRTLSAQEQKHLKKIYPSFTNLEVAQSLGLTLRELARWVKKLGIAKKSPIKRKKLVLTLSEAQFAKLYKTKTQIEISKILGVTKPNVAYWAKRLGLSKKKQKLPLRRGRRGKE